jgi:hypothetical protein
MKKTLATFGLACLLLTPAWAEQVPADVKLPMDTRFRSAPSASQFPDAPALLLQDDIKFTAAPDGSTSFEEHDVIKLFNAEGVEDHRNFIRVYQSDLENIEVKAARSILPDGRVLDIPKQAFTDEPVLPESRVYKNYRRLVIRYPGLEPGAIVEFHVVTHRKSLPDHRWWNVTYVQNPEPMIRSTYNVTVPKGTELHWADPGLHGLQPRRTHQGNQDHYFWEVANVKPYKSEPSSPPMLTQMARIEVTNFASWDQLRSWFDGLWDAAMAPTPALREQTKEICSLARTDTDKVNAVLGYLDHKLAAQQQVEDLLPHKASDLLTEPTLTTLDSVVLAASLLKISGVQVTPVLAFQQPGEAIRPELPRVGLVDQVLLKIVADGKTRWLDPEHLSALLDAPPAGYQGMAELGPQGFGTLPDFDLDRNRRESRVEARIDGDGKAEVLLDFKEFGDSAAVYRDAGRELAERSIDRREQMLDQIFDRVAHGFSVHARVHDRYFPLQSGTNAPFELAATLSVPGFATDSAGLVKVPLPVEPSERLAGLVGEHGSRQSPVHFASPVREEIRMHLMLPAGCKVVELPQTVQLKTRFGSFYATARSNNSEVWYYSRLVLLPTWVKTDQVQPLLDFARQVIGSQTSAVTYTHPVQATGSHM